jgi:16S rRNA (guanine527-N7)-methyltransferase
VFERLPDLTPEQSAVLEAHYHLLVKWNAVLNLTRIENIGEAVERHYGEALFLAKYLPPTPLQIADIGSGAGFPGFPVAVVRPDCTVTLIESHQRKAVFLRESARGVSNIRVMAKRAEEVDIAFDFAISRAVSYADLTKPLHKLAPQAFLLTGAELPPATLRFSWNEPIPLPSGQSRYLRIGRRI